MPRPTPHAPVTGLSFLSLRQTAAKASRSRSSILRDVQSGHFPRPVRLGSGPLARLAFVASEVEAWQRERISERDAQAGAA